MKFRKRMKKPIKKINGLVYEAVDWYHSKKVADRKSDNYKNNGFLSHVIFESWWAGYFVYIRS